MDILTVLLVLGTLGYIIFEFFLNEKDDTVITRLLQYSPSKMNIGKKDEEEDSSTEFIKEFVNNFAQKLIDKSKDVLAQKQLLLEAGLPSDDDAHLHYVSKKLIFAAIGGICGLFLAVTMDGSAMMRMMTLFMFPITGFRLPDIQAKSLAKKRAESVTYALPDAIDLLTICIEAGLGLDSAITRVSTEQEMAAPVLSAEFKRVGKDILAGVPRSDAFRNLSKRVASSELKSFMGLLIQSDKLGTSIGQSLKVYADAMRTKRKQKAEEQAAKASIKMTIPLVLFILPATFIVILAPAAMSMIKIFSGGAL